MMLFQGCAPHNQLSPDSIANIDPQDPPWVVRFKSTLGVRWFEVVYVDVEAGWAKNERKIVFNKGIPVYQISRTEELRLQVFGKTNVVQKKEIKTFSSTPPYPLLSYNYADKSEENLATVDISRLQDGKYQCVESYNKRSRTQTLGDISYLLKDELGLELWVQSSPAVQAQYSFLQLGLVSPKIAKVDATIHEVADENNHGKERKVYKVGVVNKIQSMGYFEFEEDGNLQFMTRGDRLKYAFRQQKPEPISGELVDLYVHNIVPIAQKIGKPDQIKRLHLSLSGPNVQLFEAASGQKVTVGEDSKIVSMILSDPESDISKTDTLHEDLAQYSTLPARITSDLPDMVKMAKEAVGDAVSTEEQITKLVKFVDEYISYDYVFQTDLADLIDNKQGDCTEHALLLTVLARTLGIPCRNAYGLVYMGDWCKGFGMHAWNEVFIDGSWKAVDATRGVTSIEPIYIRFPDEPFKRNLLTDSVHLMKIDIEKVEQKKQ